MLIKSFIVGIFSTIIAAGGITSAVVFSNLKNTTSPYPKVLTKQMYQNLVKDQKLENSSGVAKVAIDYGSLPTSSTSFYDLLSMKNIPTNAFILTVGSQAYASTNNLLNGQNKTWSEYNPNKIDSSALMLKLYDLFYNEKSEHHSAIANFNINFYSFIDVLDTQEIKNAENLLHYRMTSLGVRQDPDADGRYPIGVSNVWNVKNPDTNVSSQEPVVKKSSSTNLKDTINFMYEPESNYYEFRPDSDYETKYERVYYRNQEDIALYNTTINWANSYASSYLSGFSLNKEGSIVLAKKESGNWSFKSISSFDESTFESVLTFYNEDYEIDGDSDSSSSESTYSITKSTSFSENVDLILAKINYLKNNNTYYYKKEELK